MRKVRGGAYDRPVPLTRDISVQHTNRCRDPCHRGARRPGHDSAAAPSRGEDAAARAGRTGRQPVYQPTTVAWICSGALPLTWKFTAPEASSGTMTMFVTVCPATFQNSEPVVALAPLPG
ncbi:hypothetical protein ABH931_000347 [Streptacidiphilus sp. MAP12-33]